MRTTQELILEVEQATDADAARKLYDAHLFPRSVDRLAANAITAKTLLLTVGTQPYSVALSMAATRAERIVAIHTDESEPSLECAIRLLPPSLRPAKVIRRVVKKTDSTGVYIAMRDCLPLAATELAGVVVDFTSGTKAMTAGASTVAGFLGLRQVYIESRPMGGVALGLYTDEHLHLVDHPLVALGDLQRREAERAFAVGDFGVAERLFEELDRSRAPGFHYGARVALARAYRAWEALEFASAADHLEEVARTLLQSPRTNVPKEPLVDAVDRIATQARSCRALHLATADKTRNPAADKALTLILARWLLAYARRSVRTRPDIAALLLYRGLELAVQRRMAVNGLDSHAFAPEAATTNLLEAYNQLAGGEHQVVSFPRQLALIQGHTVLRALNDDVIRALGVEPKKVHGLTNIRNESVLAHGFKKVDAKSLVAFRQLVLQHLTAVLKADGAELRPDGDPDPDFDFVELCAG